MNQNKENTNAFLIHISAFAGFIFPFGNIITPLIAWQTLKDRSAFLDQQGKEAINFNISFTLYIFLMSLLFIPFAVGTFLNNFRDFIGFNQFHINFDTPTLFGLIGLGSITVLMYCIGVALVILAAIKANKGELYKYPFTIKFVK